MKKIKQKCLICRKPIQMEVFLPGQIIICKKCNKITPNVLEIVKKK